MSSTSKLVMAVVAALIVWALAPAVASAQGPTVIDAVDSPAPAFAPSQVTVPTGTTVRWEFDQAAATHTVTSTSGNWNVDQTRQPGGAAVEETFQSPGTYTFHCKIHGGMTGTVTVEADEPYDVLVFSRTTGFRHETAIAAGRTAITQMGAAGGFNVELSEDQTKFTDAGLRPYEVIVFLNTDGEGILNAAQRTAFERWTQRGGGIVSIHADANADRNWAWKGDMMGGAWFLNHPAAPVQFQQATVNVVDTQHPATKDLPQPNWIRTDEWYNFTAEPENVHVLLKLDESTYDEQDGSAAADDHPISWCSNYDGGRHFYTALGHEGAYWSEPDYLDHIRGAIQWASGEAAGRLRARPPRAADRRVVRQGHARRHDREPDGDRGRRERRRLLRRARRPGQVLHRVHRRGARRSARSRSTAATRTACSGSRSTRTSPPTAGCTSSTACPRPRSSASRASRSGATACSTWPPRCRCSSSRTSGSSAATRPAR